MKTSIALTSKAPIGYHMAAGCRCSPKHPGELAQLVERLVRNQ